LAKFVRTMPKYDPKDPTVIQDCIEKASEQLFAFLYLENADQDKYGSLLEGLNSQKSLGDGQYPRMLTEANNVLSDHRFDAAKPKTALILSSRANKAKKATKMMRLQRYHLPKWKGSVNAAESQDIDLQIAARRTRFQKRNG
jgi:hypothetical protein